MPHKFNATRRNEVPRQGHRVTNWAEYNEGLRRRGDLTMWVSEEAPGLWSSPRRTTRGGQPLYSDLAIELCLTLGMVFNQPLRQTQGFMCSIAGLLGVEIAVPDFSTLSRRGNGLSLPAKPKPDSDKPAHLVVDSYDGDPTRALSAERFGTTLEVAIPPPKNATFSPDCACNPTARDCDITGINAHGRIAWQKTSGDNQRSRGETQTGRWKAIIGPKSKARTFENQKTEARIGVRVLNRMTDPARPAMSASRDNQHG